VVSAADPSRSLISVFSENLVAPEIEDGTSGSGAGNS
jgi:hypothetical protein